MKQPVTPETLELLLDEHGAALELFAAQWTESPEDSVQEAFIVLARQEEAPRNMTAWLYRVVRNRAISSLRSAGRRRRRETVAAELSAAWFAPEKDGDFDREAVAEALCSLNEEQREAIIARLWGGLSFEQIAEATGSSVSTSFRRYKTGLNRLREKLGLSWLTKK